MPDAILIIVTVQTVPGLKNLCTCPTTGTTPSTASTPTNTTVLTVFIVARFSWAIREWLPRRGDFRSKGAVQYADGPEPGRTLNHTEQNRRSTAAIDGDRPRDRPLFKSAHRIEPSPSMPGCPSNAGHLQRDRRCPQGSVIVRSPSRAVQRSRQSRRGAYLNLRVRIS